MSKLFDMRNKKTESSADSPEQVKQQGLTEEEQETEGTEEVQAEELPEEMEKEEAISEEEQLLLDQQEKIAELENRVSELSESNLRKTAELDNARKRMQRERIQLYETSRASAIEHFLPVYDDLQRVLDALGEGEEVNLQAIDEGIRLVAGKFRDALKQYDVERIDETGVPFDVDLHDALMRRKPEDENTGSDVVLQVLENGYKMGDRTIRHAKVIVSE